MSNGSHEVELRLRTTITPHSITGYEVNFSLNPNSQYLEIVRWNGPLDNFTLLASAPIYVVNGDVVKATAIGNTITVYKNGTQVLQTTDSTYSTGSPGIGFYDNADTNWTGFGFSNFSASNVSASNVSASNISASNVGSGSTVDQDTEAEAPSVSISSSAITVNAGDSIALGISAAPVDSDDSISVTISGVPSFETITAPSADIVTRTKNGSTYTYTISAPAGQAVTDLSLTSNYTGTSHPVNVFTVTATNSTSGETATSAPKTITVTDPPAATLTPANSPQETSSGSNRSATADNHLAPNVDRAVWLSELKPYDLPSAVAQDWASELRPSTIGGLDLSDIAFVSRTTHNSYAADGNSTGGGLTESDSMPANIALLSQYMAAGFVKSMDGFDGGTLIHDAASVTNAHMLALSQHG